MEEEKKSNSTALIVGIIVLVLCICVIVLGMGGAAYYAFNQTTDLVNDPAPNNNNNNQNQPATGDICRPYFEPVIIRSPVGSISNETIETLQTTIVPNNDPRSLACRLKGICNVPEVMATSAPARIVSDKDKFWVHNLDTNVNNSVDATLRYITPHVYFWVQDGVDADAGEIKTLVETFENKTYPTNREFFGDEWSPGIDGDEHIYILYARGLGSSVAGYFSSADSFHPLIQEYSNGHEMFLFNADNTDIGGDYAYGVLAHEFQHMIHWNQDGNETSWINEGSSVLASFLNGYDTGGFDWLYITDPDLQLNDWPNNNDCTTPHYGAGFLFMTYFLDRFGEEATQLLVKDDANGLESVDDVLREINATDSLTGKPITADSFFMDWAVTNFLVDDSVGDGRFTYHNYPGAYRASATESIFSCPLDTFTRDVRQFGVDYISIQCPGDHTIHFTGSTATSLLPADPYSGDYAFWSNKGDESDMTLTREFDFTDVSGPIELSFRTWYDIETDWDYVYLESSEDGENWEIMITPSGSGTDPSGNSYGWGYTGVTDDWIEEKIDLSQFAGKKVFLRFEYVTDANVHGEGFMLDDVKVDAASYSSDFEPDDGGWQADGFVRVQNVLPQTFGLALIKTNDSSVTMIPVNEDQTAEISISLEDGEKAYLVVSGLTRYTRVPAAYEIEIR